MRKPKRNNGLETWEIALIKAMLASGRFSKQEILAHFSRPDRDINPARVHEILTGKLGKDTPLASDGQLTTFLAKRGHVDDLRPIIISVDPLSSYSLSEALPLRAGSSQLDIRESETVEAKEKLSWEKKERRRLLTTMAGYANNKGGYIVFGVEDETFTVRGCETLLDTEAAKISDTLTRNFAPMIRWDHARINIGGSELPVIYVWEANHKPVVAISESAAGEDTGIGFGDIFYRYPGLSKKIAPAELEEIIREREDKINRRWETIIRNIRSIGVENVALMNTLTGRVDGPSGTFLIDERLLPQISFIKDGQFSEQDGAPTLKLIGDVKPIDHDRIQPVLTEKTNIHELDVILDFARGVPVSNPEAYLRHMADMRALWLPIYYYIKLANLTHADAATLIAGVSTHAKDHKAKLIKRLVDMREPPNMRTAESRKSLPALKGNTPPVPKTEFEALHMLSAMRQLGPDDLDFHKHGHLLASITEAFFNGAKGRLLSEIRYTAAWIDYMIFAKR